MINKINDDAFKKLLKNWDKAERLLKKSENLRIEVNFAAINELRYAGRRLADAQNLYFSENFDSNSLHTLIREAEQFCLRAQHDCVDSIVLFLRARIEELEKQHTRMAISKHIPNYIKAKTVIKRVSLIVEESREKRGERAEIYDVISEKEIPELISYFEEIEANEELFRTELNKEKREKIILWATVFSLIAGIVGAIAGVFPILKPP